MRESQQSYKNLIVWQKSMDLVREVYTITRSFPDDERFGSTSQMRRAAVSVPSNIAEESRKGSKDRNRFHQMAYGSASELETQVEIAKQLKYCAPQDVRIVDSLLIEVLKMLNKMTRY